MYNIQQQNLKKLLKLKIIIVIIIIIIVIKYIFINSLKQNVKCVTQMSKLVFSQKDEIVNFLSTSLDVLQ